MTACYRLTCTGVTTIELFKSIERFYMKIAVRELKSQLSATLAKVTAGQSATITSHGRPVARLIPPVAEFGGGLAALVATGLVTPAERSGGLAPRKLVELPAGAGSLSDAVIEDRG